MSSKAFQDIIIFIIHNQACNFLCEMDGVSLTDEEDTSLKIAIFIPQKHSFLTQVLCFPFWDITVDIAHES